MEHELVLPCPMSTFLSLSLSLSLSKDVCTQYTYIHKTPSPNTRASLK